MKTKEIKVYKLDELSEKAQELAHHQYLVGEMEYPWAEKNRQSLQEFERIFPVKVKDWEYGCRSFINWSYEGDEEARELSGVRLLKFIYNNYYLHITKPKFLKSFDGEMPKNISQIDLDIRGKKGASGHYYNVYSKLWRETDLTGYCMDYALLKPIEDFMKNPSDRVTFEGLLGDCLESWVSECEKDYEYACSFEAFKETAEANEWEFLENGEMA